MPIDQKTREELKQSLSQHSYLGITPYEFELVVKVLTLQALLRFYSVIR